MCDKNSVTYQQLISSQSLSTHIDQYDVIQGGKRIKKMIMPQTEMSLVFDFARNSLINTNHFRVFLLGLHDCQWPLDTIHETNDRLVVRFSPGGLRSLTSVPANFLFNQIVDGKEIFGNEINDLYDRLTDGTSHDTRIECIEAFLWKRHQAVSRSDGAIVRLAKTIRLDPYAFSFESIKRNEPLGLRQIERKFQTLIGVNLRTYLRIARFEKVRWLMENRQATRLTDTGYEVGYFDQAHFSTEFKKMAGVSPSNYEPCHAL